MRLEEAIGRLDQSKNWYEFHNAIEQVKAHQLGIEALKQIQIFQFMEQPYKGLTLPSETKE